MLSISYGTNGGCEDEVCDYGEEDGFGQTQNDEPIPTVPPKHVICKEHRHLHGDRDTNYKQ